MEKKQLPDTPWHIGYTKKEEDDPRRHKARCIYKRAGKCTQGKSGCFMLSCAGSSHCIYYAESEEQAEKVLLATMTIDEEAAERAERYRLARIRDWEKLSALGVIELKKKYGNVRICPICKDDLPDNRICPYCGFNLDGRTDLINKTANGRMKNSRYIKNKRSYSQREQTREEEVEIHAYEKVYHKKWGEGTILNVSVNKVTVRFASGDRIFYYPAAFQKGFLIKE